MLDKELRGRVSNELYERVESYCRQKRIRISDFVRLSAIAQITPDVEDKTLVFESLRQLHEKMHTVESQQDISFSFFCLFIQHFLVYNPELPVDQRKAAGVSAMQRFDKLFNSFQESMKNNPSMFESLLADFFEETEQ